MHKTLRYLDFDQCFYINDSFLKFLADIGSATLRILEMRYLEKITNEGVAKILISNMLPSLKQVIVEKCPGLTLNKKDLFEIQMTRKAMNLHSIDTAFD